MNKGKEYIKDEIRKEFQLERMVLFSDAVFAIVITLMAIEIRMPDLPKPFTSEMISTALIKLIPVAIAYAVSFIFIGQTWYHHLQAFSLLKDFDKGLVVRNLIMLFFIGFFPFSATLITKFNNGLFLPITIYFLVILSGKTAQLVLNHYILVKHPQLRINSDIHDEMLRFKRSRLAVVLLSITFLLISITNYTIKDPELKDICWFWFFPFAFVLRYMKRRIK